MRKLFILFITVVFLVSCNVQVPVREGIQTISLKGTLLLQKRSSGGGELVVLHDDQGKNVALTSLAIDLAKPDYVGNLVDLSGFFKDGDSVFEVTGIAVLEVNKSAEKDGVLTDLVSSANGFQISYFDNWDVDEQDGNVVFSFMENKSVIARFSVVNYSFEYTNLDDGSVTGTGLDTGAFSKSALNDFFAKMSIEGSAYHEREIGVDHYFSYYSSDKTGEVYYLYRNGIVYKVFFEPVSTVSSDLLDLKNKFLTSLATFKFIAFTSDEKPVVSTAVPQSISSAPYDGEMTPFESFPYSFMGMYPQSWYYAGSKSYELGVLHHYAFSDESVDGQNAKIFLDVLSTPLPDGEILSLDGREYHSVLAGDMIEYYFNFEGRTFKIWGSSSLNPLVLAIAGSIKKLDLPSGG